LSLVKSIEEAERQQNENEKQEETSSETD